MKSIFNVRTAIAACLAVTIVSLCSFSDSSSQPLVGTNEAVSLKVDASPIYTERTTTNRYIIFTLPKPFNWPFPVPRQATTYDICPPLIFDNPAIINQQQLQQQRLQQLR